MLWPWLPARRVRGRRGARRAVRRAFGERARGTEPPPDPARAATPARGQAWRRCSRMRVWRLGTRPRMTSKASDEDFTLTIRGSGAGEYLLLAESPDDKEPESFRAFVSTVDGEKFLNIQDEEWILVNYRVSGDLLQLRLVDDKLFKISRTRGSMAGRRKATGTGSWSGAGPEPKATPARPGQLTLRRPAPGRSPVLLPAGASGRRRWSGYAGSGCSGKAGGLRRG